MTARLAVLVVLALAILPACSGPLRLLTGGGPNVAANVQAGRTNSQTLGQTANTDQRITAPAAQRVEQTAGATGVRAEQVERVVVNQTSPWMVALLLAAWALPTPAQMAARLAAWIAAAWAWPRRRKKGG